MTKHALLTFGALGLLTLGACSTTTVTTNLATAQSDAKTLVTAYTALKAAADIFELTNSTYDAQITAAEAIADPLVAELEPLVTDASADAATIEDLITQVETQITAIKAVGVSS